MSRGDGALFSVDFTSDGNVVIKEEKTKGKNTRATYVAALMLAWKRLAHFKTQAQKQKEDNEQFFTLIEKYKVSLLNLESAFAGNCIELTFNTDMACKVTFVADKAFMEKAMTCSSLALLNSMTIFGLDIKVITDYGKTLDCGIFFTKDLISLAGQLDNTVWLSESLPLSMLEEKFCYR